MTTQARAHREVDGRGRSISTAILYEVVEAMRELDPGAEIVVTADALPAVDSDVRAWCRTTGHELVGVEEGDRERRYRVANDRSPPSAAALGAGDLGPGP